MYRYVGVLLIVLTVHDLWALAAGNIGCLFSDTLCEQDREWCFDDHAFGRCLPTFGHVKQNDLHLYALGSKELKQLEQEMQRLFMLGYRWSHTYTQCVLQAFLQSVKDNEEFDLSTCNSELDQDLEGALRAIEGEELEKVDPRDLAIVRFTPSATDPHSDYADEVYFPPIKDQLALGAHEHDPEHEPDPHQESSTVDPMTGGRASDQNLISPHAEGGGGGGGGPGSPSLPVNQPRPPQPIPRHPELRLQSPPLDHPTAHNDPSRENNYIRYYDPDETDYEDEDVYRSPYHFQLSNNPVFRKRAQGGIWPLIENLEEDAPSLPPLSQHQFENLGDILGNLKIPDRYDAEETVFFPERLQEESEDEDDEEDEDEGVFDEEPARPVYTEGGLQYLPELDDKEEMDLASEGTWSNMPQNFQAVPGGMRNLPEYLQNMPEFLNTVNGGDLQGYPEELRKIPSDLRNLPSSLRNFPAAYGQYVPREFIPESLASDNSIRPRFMQEKSPVVEPKLSEIPVDRLLLEEEVKNILGRKPNKFSALEAAFGSQMNSIRDYDNNYQDYPDYGILDYGDYGDYGDDQLVDDQRPPFLQKFVKKDEESVDGDLEDLFPDPNWNLQRMERLDVKKPGPNFNSDNNYAFDTGEEEDNTANEEQDELPRGRLGLELLGSEFDPRPLQKEDLEILENNIIGNPYTNPYTRFEAPPEGAQDLLLADEGFVDEVSSDVIPEVKGPILEEKKAEEEAETTISPTEEKQEEVDTVPKASNTVLVTVSEKIETREAGEKLVKAIVEKAGLQPQDIQNVDTEVQEVTFEVKENQQGITAEDVAKSTEKLKDEIKAETGMTITESRVGGIETAVSSAMIFSPSEQHILAAAAIVCGVMAALVVAATVLFFLRRHAKARAKLQGINSHDTEASKDYEDLCRARMAGKGSEGTKQEQPAGTHAPSQRVSSLSRDSDNGNNSPSSRSSTSSCEEPVASNMDISTGHMVLSYMEDHLKKKDRLEQEWIALCAYEAEPCATTIALKPENSKKNRYPDSVPYDHNRVILNAHANLNGSDYINASSITDHDPRNPAYIATQGPLESTAADFWQLVWEQGSVVVVMLTRLTENGNQFCHRYWPEEGSDLYHIYEVHLVSEHIWCDDYLVRSFYLKNVRTGETRTVTQFHFLSWPDSGTPASTKALLEFRRKVNKSYRGRSCPIIVHCSDGIGRTGTYSLIDMVLNRMAKGAKEIDIAATLEHIRDQRPHMVKSKAQFEFVLMAVAEEVHAILKALPQ